MTPCCLQRDLEQAKGVMPWLEQGDQHPVSAQGFTECMHTMAALIPDSDLATAIHMALHGASPAAAAAAAAATEGEVVDYSGGRGDSSDSSNDTCGGLLLAAAAAAEGCGRLRSAWSSEGEADAGQGGSEHSVDEQGGEHSGQGAALPSLPEDTQFLQPAERQAEAQGQGEAQDQEAVAEAAVPTVHPSKLYQQYQHPAGNSLMDLPCLPCGST